ncbi:MAG: YtxH domain-containing protein [Acidobacteria bacterium]|nr:YtxH domain-containing protein [Acidobacteriota bacterium]
MSNRGNSGLEVTLSFLLGTAAGFILGVLFAPASGEETRKKIQEQAHKTGDKAKASYEKIVKEAEKGIHMVKDKTAEGIDAVKEFVEKKKMEFNKDGHERVPEGDKKDKDIF